MRRALALALATAAVASPLAACGGRGGSGDSSSSSSGTSTQTVERTTRVEVVKQLSPKGHAAVERGFDAASIYSRDAPGVVTIISILGQSGAAGGEGGPGTQGAEGSGFVLNDQGEIATNAHVVTDGQGAGIHKASEVYVRFSDDNQVPATIVGFDPNADVALLRVDPAGLTLRPLPLGDSGALTVGEPVAAIGSPFGEEQSLSVGVISATGRTIDSLTSFSISGAIQTDAAINHGNSGGPLVDARGAVLGINSQIKSGSGDGTGVGFAVPVGTVKRSIDQLRAKGHVDYAYLGVQTSMMYPQLARRLGLAADHGAYLGKVTPGGPADKAGLKAGTTEVRFQAASYPTGSDLVTQVAGHDVSNDADLSQLLSPYQPGQKVQLTVVRGKDTRSVEVTLGKRPSAVQG